MQERDRCHPRPVNAYHLQFARRRARHGRAQQARPLVRGDYSTLWRKHRRKGQITLSDELAIEQELGKTPLQPPCKPYGDAEMTHISCKRLKLSNGDELPQVAYPHWI